MAPHTTYTARPMGHRRRGESAASRYSIGEREYHACNRVTSAPSDFASPIDAPRGLPPRASPEFVPIASATVLDPPFLSGSSIGAYPSPILAIAPRLAA